VAIGRFKDNFRENKKWEKTSGKSGKVNSRGDHKWESSINAYWEYHQTAKILIMPK